MTHTPSAAPGPSDLASAKGAPQPGASADDLTLALRLADVADAISLARFGAADLHVSAKPDLTPVSDADLAVEQAIRGVLSVERPGDAVLGEEFGVPDAEANREWVIDPIDGTKNYVRGVPVWATLIALLVDGRPSLGVVSAPALVRRWWALAGAGASGSFRGATRSLHVSAVVSLSDASLSYSSPFAWADAGAAGGFSRLMENCWRTRAYGDFYSYMLVAEGAVDIAGEPELSLWDLAALAPIVGEAGGRFTDVTGGPVGRRTRSALATNGLLHAAVVDTLAVPS